MEDKICPIKGCKNIRQKRGKDKYKMCCRRHTQKYQEKLGVDTRTIRRSITPQGFAKAFYQANK